MAAEAFYDLKFSPDGRMLAAACRDRCVHVFDVAKKKRVGHCSGHSSSVMHVDWSKARMLNTRGVSSFNDFKKYK